MKIINIRGAGGSGKTELVRRILADYGWVRGGPDRQPHTVEALKRAGRQNTFGYRLQHPLGRRALAALGDYARTSGGCDTIRAADGGFEEIFARAGEYALAGDDVLIEGLRLSTEVERTAGLSRTTCVHIFVLDTAPEDCARNLAGRQRLARRAWPALAVRAAREMEEIRAAVDRLPPTVHRETGSFDAVRKRVQELLELR
jgi:hypothetical protein